MRARLRNVDPSLAAIVAEGFLSRLSFGLVTFALPLYAVRELGLSLAEVGFLASFNLMVAIALKPFMGSLADRFGLRRGLATAIGMRSLVSLLLVFVAAPWQLFGVRGLHGVSMSLRDPSVNALIAEHGGKRTIASAFAWYQTAKSVAGSAGKVLAGVLLTVTASSFSVVFLVAFLLSALPLIVVLRYVRAPAVGAVHYASSVTPDPPAEADRAARADDPRPPIAPFMGLGFLISGTAYMLTNLFPIFAVEYAGLSEAAAGSLYAFGTVAMLTAPAFGWLSDNVSRKLVLSVRSVANVLSSVLYLVAPSYGGLAAGRTLDDMGKAAFRPAWGALMAHVSSYSPRRRARTMGYLSVGEDAGELAGPIVAGLLWATWGVPVLLGVRIALAIVTELYTLALTGSLKKLDELPPADREERARTEPALRMRAGPASAAEP
jgi:MFS family permease